jgi:hypothetical protein
VMVKIGFKYEGIGRHSTGRKIRKEDSLLQILT